MGLIAHMAERHQDIFGHVFRTGESEPGDFLLRST